MLIIRMSMDKEKPMMKMLKFVSLLYFFRPFATRFYMIGVNDGPTRISSKKVDSRVSQLL